jgi:hypothetical protein
MGDKRIIIADVIAEELKDWSEPVRVRVEPYGGPGHEDDLVMILQRVEN